MAIVTVTGMTAERMLASEAQMITSASLSATTGDLTFSRRNGSTVNVGRVTGQAASGYATSTTSRAITTGSVTFTYAAQPAPPFPLNAVVVVRPTANLSRSMAGFVTACTTTSVTINVQNADGSGTYSSWTLAIGALSRNNVGISDLPIAPNNGMDENTIPLASDDRLLVFSQELTPGGRWKPNAIGWPQLRQEVRGRVVHIVGTVTPVEPINTSLNNTLIATIPSYRPTRNLMTAAMSGGVQLRRVDILPNGEIRYQMALTVETWVYIDCMYTI